LSNEIYVVDILVMVKYRGKYFYIIINYKYKKNYEYITFLFIIDLFNPHNAIIVEIIIMQKLYYNK